MRERQRDANSKWKVDDYRHTASFFPMIVAQKLLKKTAKTYHRKSWLMEIVWLQYPIYKSYFQNTVIQNRLKKIKTINHVYNFITLKEIRDKGNNCHFFSLLKYWCFRTFPWAKSNFVPKGIPIGVETNEKKVYKQTNSQKFSYSYK